MTKTKFMEILSEIIELEIDAVLKSSVKYQDDEAENIIVLTDDETRFCVKVETANYN